MKYNYKKIYLLIGFFVLALLFSLFGTLKQNQNVLTIGSVSLTKTDYPKQWKNIISKQAKTDLLSLKVDGREVDFKDSHLYVDDDMEVMIPIDYIRDVFKCAVLSYADNHIYIQKGNDIVYIYPDFNYIKHNGDSIKFNNPMRICDDGLYVNLKIFNKFFGYEYNDDFENQELALVDSKASSSILPVSYNYRDVGRLPEIKNQGRDNTCWANASLSAIESIMKPMEETIYIPLMIWWKIMDIMIIEVMGVIIQELWHTF